MEPSDPIPANHIAIFRSGQVFENASASLDDARRSNVVLVAYEQYSVNTFLTSDLDCLARYLGCVPQSPKLWQDRVTDMPPVASEPLIQAKAYGSTADKRTIDLGCQECRMHPV